MNRKTISLSDVSILDEAVYERAQIQGLETARALTQDVTAVVIPEGRGLGRLLNLLDWDVHKKIEFLDDEGLYGDQLIHIAAHQALDATLGHHPRAKLLAECWASAVDIYLLGKFSQAGEECEFLVETMESFSSYYELYTEDNRLEKLLAEVVDKPFKAASGVARYLYGFGDALLGAEPDLLMLAALADDNRYPLVHHYNLANWLLTLRGDEPGPTPDFASAESRMRELLDIQAND